MRESIRNSGILEGYNNFLEDLRKKGVPTLYWDHDDTQENDDRTIADVFIYAAQFLEGVYEGIKAKKKAESKILIEKRRNMRPNLSVSNKTYREAKIVEKSFLKAKVVEKKEEEPKLVEQRE